VTAALPANDPQVESLQARSRAAGVTPVARDSDTPGNVGKPEKPAVMGVTPVTAAAVTPGKVQLRRVRPLKPFARSKRNQPSA